MPDYQVRVIEDGLETELVTSGVSPEAVVQDVLIFAAERQVDRAKIGEPPSSLKVIVSNQSGQTIGCVISSLQLEPVTDCDAVVQ